MSNDLLYEPKLSYIIVTMTENEITGVKKLKFNNQFYPPKWHSTASAAYIFIVRITLGGSHQNRDVMVMLCWNDQQQLYSQQSENRYEHNVTHPRNRHK